MFALGWKGDFILFAEDGAVDLYNLKYQISPHRCSIVVTLSQYLALSAPEPVATSRGLLYLTKEDAHSNPIASVGVIELLRQWRYLGWASASSRSQRR